MATKKSILDQVCGTPTAAERLGVTESRVKQLCSDGTLTAKREGVAWIITLASVEAYAQTPRKRGPKPKPKQ